MVSLQASLSQEDQGKVMSPNFETNSKKRKWQELEDQHQNQVQQSKRSQEKVDDIDEPNLDAPLPLEWQRCLDIKSGQIHFYNTRTHKRTSKDPRFAPEPRPPSPSPSPSLSLDLELNLNSSSNHVDQVQAKHDNHQLSHVDHQHKSKSSSSSSSSSSSCSPSWITLDVDRQEMVAAVCMRCHMLVMMCKATPSCPNCKFVHPQGQSSSSSSSLISNNKPAGFRLLCCKD